MVNKSEGVAKRLPVGKVLLGAVLLPWHRRSQFARTLAVPFLFQVLLVLVWQIAWSTMESFSSWLMAAVSYALYVLIAVRCHRLMLLEESASVWHLPKWTLRESRFIVYLIGLWALHLAVTWSALYLIALPIGFIPRGGPPDKVLSYLPVVASLIAYYPMSRLSLSLPAIAVDKFGGFRKSWDQSRGNGLRLAIVVGALPAIASYVSRAPDLLGQNLFLDVLQQILVYVFVVVEVTALSLSYREIRQENSETSICVEEANN